MPNPVFPVALNDQHDSSKYEVSAEDPAMRQEMDGGYVVSRARFTRPPRKSWKTGFTFMNDTNKLLLENFWASVKGGSVIFDWINPQDNVTYAVRFTGGLAFRYRGAGNTHRWDVTISLEQA